MNQFTCPFCKRWVFYDDDHPCFTYMSEDDTISMPRLEDLDEKGKTHIDAQDGLMEHSNGSSAQLCSSPQQNESEKPQHVYPLPIENEEQLSFTSTSNCEGNFGLILERTSENAQLGNPYNVSMMEFTLNNRANEIQSNENASLKAFQEKIEPDSISQKDISGSYKSTSFVTGFNYEQKKRESMFSNLFHAKSTDECGVSTEERKLQSLNKDEENCIGTLAPVTENASSDNTNISGTSSFLLNYDVLHLNEKPDNEMIGAFGNPKDQNIISEQLSQVQSNTEEMAVKEDKPIVFIKEDNAVAGPSRLRPSKNFYACEFCPKQYACKSRLAQHILIHTGDKSFVCDVCKRGFARKSTLTAHIRTHTGEKPFICPLCEKAYTRRSTCYDHQRRVHK